MPSDPLWGSLFLQIFLILINAFFAAAEIAVISLNENKLRKQSEEGDKKAGKMLKMLEQPAGFLSTIQIGITLAGFLGSAFAADNFADPLVNWLVNTKHVTALSPATLNTLAVIVITLILSYFTLVLGELVPKRLAMQKSEQVARFAISVIAFTALVMKPVIWFLSISTNGILRLLHIDPNAESEQVTEEEIRLMVDAGEEKGTIETNEREMIENIFEFNNTTAEDVMTHRTDVSAIWIDDTDEEIVDTIEDTGLSRFPVYEEDIDDILGILNTREYLLNSRSKNPKTIQELIRPAYFVPELVKTDVLFREMQIKKVHLAIVVDEYGGTSGIVTMEDLLEEIVGNIYDEFDPNEEQEIIAIEENLWRVSGSIDMETLKEALNMDFAEEEEYETLGGLIFSQLTTIPDDGSNPEIDVFGLHIKVEEISDRRVEWALVSKTGLAQGTE